MPLSLPTQLLFAKSMQELQLGVGASVGCFVERGLLSGRFPYSILMFICHFMAEKKRFIDLNSFLAATATGTLTDPETFPLPRQPSSTMPNTAYHEQYMQLANE